MSKKPMVNMVNATEAKNRFGEMIKRAYLHEEHLIVKRGGIPVVAIVPMQDYERLVAAEDLPDEISQEIVSSAQAASSRTRLKEFLAHAHPQIPDVPEEEVNQDIQEAITAVRAQV